MPAKLPVEQLAESTQFMYAGVEQRELSPRIRMALRMYALAAVPTLTAAAEACGVSLAYLSQMSNSPAGKTYMAMVQGIIDEKATVTTDILNILGRRALNKIAALMEEAGSENIQLRAAVDLADRSPETSKVQKVQVESFSLAGKDARMLAEAIVQGHSVHERYASLAEGNYVKIPIEETTE